MNRIVLISVFYFFILLFAAVLPDGISDYNAYVVLLISVLYALMIKSADVYLDTLICSAAV